jgi:hypothetical protein
MIFRSMTVTFAVGFEEADDLLEEIIRKHPHPRTLTVVSSDLRVQRCAKARKASSIGCDQWLMQLDNDHPSDPSADAAQADRQPDEKPQLSAEEVQKWLREFGL